MFLRAVPNKKKLFVSRIASDLFLPGDTVACLEMQYLKAGRPGVQEKSSHCMVLSANSCPTNRALITVYCASGRAGYKQLSGLQSKRPSLHLPACLMPWA